MSGRTEPDELQPGDILYRRLSRGQWNGVEVSPAAFRDRYEHTSFLVVRVVGGPRQALDWFARLKHIRTQFGGRSPSAEELIEQFDWGLAVVPASAIFRLGLTVAPDLKTGRQIRPDGHVDISGAGSRAIQLAEESRALDLRSVLGMDRT